MQTHIIFKEKNEVFATLNFKPIFFRQKQRYLPEICNFPQNSNNLLKNAEFGKVRNSLERLVFKSLKNDSDSNISVKVSTRETRSASNGILLNVGKCRTVNNQNSYYIRAAKVWNTQGRRKIDKWGGGIFIYSCSQTVKTIDFKIYVTISKEINCAEHEYMNIAPPPPIIDLPAPLGTLFRLILETTLSLYHHLKHYYVNTI